MDNFNSMEDKLGRLTPSSLSQAGQEKLEETIDQLAMVDTGSANVAGAAEGGPVRSTTTWPWKAAAALALLAAPVVMLKLKEPLSSQSLATNDPFTDAWKNSVLVVLKTTNRIDGREDDGLIIPDDGSAPHYRFRYHVTDEEQVCDPQTGTVITLRQPRQEVVTIPVTEF